MPCSRYFRDDELPSNIVVVRETQEEFWSFIYDGLSKKEKAVVDARPDFEKTKIWFVAHQRVAPFFSVRSQPLLRQVDEQYWGANDCNPPWSRKVKESPWFATEQEATEYFTRFMAQGLGNLYEKPFMWWMRENHDRAER